MAFNFGADHFRLQAALPSDPLNDLKNELSLLEKLGQMSDLDCRFELEKRDSNLHFVRGERGDHIYVKGEFLKPVREMLQAVLEKSIAQISRKIQ